jgi:hypothetical protein
MRSEAAEKKGRGVRSCSEQSRTVNAPTPEPEPVEHLRRSLLEGCDWPTALLQAVALWTLPSETYRGRAYTYLIEGEAFNWLLLAERLCQAVEGLIPEDEMEELLLRGRFPDYFDESRFRELLGVDKYRAHLNYFYGVTVEEALQLAAEAEVRKRHYSNGNQYQDDFSEEAFTRIYRESKGELLRQFREAKGYPNKRSITISESREFTYWLFKYRLKWSDKAKIASDTRKGLEQLRRMAAARREAISPPVPLSESN